MTDFKKQVDESWKENVAQEKGAGPSPLAEDQQAANHKKQGCCGHDHDHEDGACAAEMEVNFVNYISSLIFQAMIFLGELPNPLNENQLDKNLPQAKFLIDTLILLREKTKGNLIAEESGLLESAIYELQMKYVQIKKTESGLTI
jgi:hypothetical protein